jgi:hypothetical protein
VERSGSRRVNRGGSFNNNDASNLRAANRNNNAPGNVNTNLGFRCASFRLARRVPLRMHPQQLAEDQRSTSCARHAWTKRGAGVTRPRIKPSSSHTKPSTSGVY